MRYTDQNAFIAWCFDEPHAGIHVLHLDPPPAASGPPRVELEWGVPAPGEDDAPDQFMVWRLRCDGVQAYRLHGDWSPAIPGDLRPHAPTAPMFLRMDVPGDLLVECAAIDVELLGPRAVALPRTPCRNHLTLKGSQEATTLGDLLEALGLEATITVRSFSGREAAATDRLAALRDRSARAWRVGVEGDAELIALTPDRTQTGFQVTLQRRTAADALWDRAWSLPSTLPGITGVRSGAVHVDAPTWGDVALADGVDCGELDPAQHGRALESDP